jgi:hypothetical protein
MFFTPTSRPLSRRSFLKGAGVALSLPLLDAMQPAFAGGADKGKAPRRMVAIETNMGILPQFFFPEEPAVPAGSEGKMRAHRDYKLSPYLELLKDHRNDFTVFSGVSHPGVDGGHQAENAFLTAAPHPGSGGFKNSVSLDQLAAEQIGTLTRYPTLPLQVCQEGGLGLSFTRSGVLIPGEKSPARLYQRLFVQGTPKEVEARIEDLRLGRSLLDFVGGSAKRLQKDLGPRDRERLDQYFTSIRDLEGQLVNSEGWERKPKPKVTAPAPTDITDNKKLVERIRSMYEMIRLALETDSTRLVTLFVYPAGIVPEIDGVKHETHSLTHHGGRPETLAELRKIEEAQLKVLSEFLTSLRGAKEEGGTLLDRTMVLYGTCMGSANAHSNTNLPVLLAGGGFRHGQHLAFDRQKNYPLPNLYVSMLQRLGIEADKFASSTGTMRGLEMV